MALQPRSSPTRLRFQNWNNFADLRRNSFPANVNNPPQQWARSPTAREVARILTIGARVVGRVHPLYRTLSTAYDLYSLYQAYQAGHTQGVNQGFQSEAPDPGWERYVDGSPKPQFLTDGYVNNGTIYGVVWTGATERTTVMQTDARWNNLTYVAGRAYFTLQTEKYTGVSPYWYTRRYDSFRSVAAVPMPDPVMGTNGVPVTQISAVPDPVLGYVPSPLQVPGQEYPTVTVPVRQIRNWNRLNDFLSGGLSHRHNGINRRPQHWPALEIIVTPGQAVQIQPAVRHRYRRPPRGQPERKSNLGRSFQPLVRFIGERAARRVVRTMDAAGEANDWLNAIYYALPEDIRDAFRGSDRLPHQKAQILFWNFSELDLQQVAVNLAIMEVQDRVLGQVSSGAVRRLRAAPGSQQRGFEFFGSFI